MQVIAKMMLTEAQKQSINCRGIHAEKDTGNKIRSKHHDYDRHVHKIQLIVEFFSGKVDIGDRSHSDRHHHFGQEKEKIGNFVQSHHSQKVSHQQIECIPCTRTEWFAVNCAHNVRISAHKSQKSLQTPKEAFTAAQNASRHFVIPFFELVIDVFKKYANHTANRYNE